MSNNKTGFIKFLILLLVFSLTAGLSACQQIQNKIYDQPNHEAIMGGKSVIASSVFSKRVIYLALGSKNKVGLCTASALSPNVLLTAAHCVKGLELNEINAILSDNPRSPNLTDKEKIKIKKVVIHEEYRDETKQQGVLHNDIALLQLAENIDTDRVSQIATMEQTAKILNLVSIGYGKRHAIRQTDPVTPNNKKIEDQLFYIMKTVEDYKIFEKTFSINQNDLTGVCSGDSGGPGFIYDAELRNFFIVGVTSYISVSRAEKDQLDPNDIYDKCMGRGYYSNMLHYGEWIERQLNSSMRK